VEKNHAKAGVTKPRLAHREDRIKGGLDNTASTREAKKNVSEKNGGPTVSQKTKRDEIGNVGNMGLRKGQLSLLVDEQESAGKVG